MFSEDDDRPSQQSWISSGVKRLVDCEPLFMLLLTCVGFLPVLMGAAIHQVQEAANRSECKSGLRQIGLALHNYNNSVNALPVPAGEFRR